MNDTTPPHWQACRHVPVLEQHAIHIWRIDLKTYPCDPACLNTSEIERLTQWQNTQAKACFCATRSALRYLLGQYLQLSPAEVPLLINQQGKPYVDGDSIYFNLSHTGDQAMFAFSHCGAVGIDLEKPRPIKNINAIAKRVFDNTSQQQLAIEGYTQEAFLRHWVCFEAKQKCTGQGVFGETEHNLDFYAAPLLAGRHFCVAWQKSCNNPSLEFLQFS